MGTAEFNRILESAVNRLVAYDVAFYVPRQVAAQVAAISEEIRAESKAAGKLELIYSLVHSNVLSTEQAHTALMMLYHERALPAKVVNGALAYFGLTSCITLPTQV